MNNNLFQALTDLVNDAVIFQDGTQDFGFVEPAAKPRYKITAKNLEYLKAEGCIFYHPEDDVWKITPRGRGELAVMQNGGR